MAEAKLALETLSADPEARRLADLRKDARIFRSEYAKKLRAEGVEHVIERLAAEYGLEVDEDRRARWWWLSERQLQDLVLYLVQHRAFPPLEGR